MALFLYGESDPDAIAAAGLHGLGGRVGRITLTRTAPCRFTVAIAGRSEDIDFRRVTAIRHTRLDDPASGLAGLFGGGGQAPPSRRPRLTLAVIAGRDDAICNADGCVAQRAFALADPDRLEQARAAAADFQAHLCGGDRSGAPPASGAG